MVVFGQVCTMVFFFFQAEDGIRDLTVTGVQTCALPILQIHQLDNGLTIYLTENHETPRFEAQIAVRAGSKQDPAESTGLAHYLEHMLFKGTTKVGTLDYEKEKPHLDRVTELYEKHFHETDPEKRKAIYAEINQESQLAARYEIPNEMDKLYKRSEEHTTEL